MVVTPCHRRPCYHTRTCVSLPTAGVTLDELSAGTTLKVPTPLSLATFSTPSSSSSTHSSTSSSSGSGSSSSASSSSGSIASGNGAWKAKGGEGTDGAAAAAVLNAVASGSAPANGLVAVKVRMGAVAF